MKYNINWLKSFNGVLDPSLVKMSDLTSSIEKNVSQFEYFYKTKLPGFEDIILEIRNEHIPHLLGLSKRHYYGSGLPTYNGGSIFVGLKNDWTLENLIKGDRGWFEENNYKIVGVLLLYQILNIQNCKIYTTKYILNKPMGKNFKRDNIYFIILKLSNNISYTLEISPSKESEEKNVYFPRSLKINDYKIEKCTEINAELIKKKRIPTRKYKKIKWR